MVVKHRFRSLPTCLLALATGLVVWKKLLLPVAVALCHRGSFSLLADTLVRGPLLLTLAEEEAGLEVTVVWLVREHVDLTGCVI